MRWLRVPDSPCACERFGSAASGRIVGSVVTHHKTEAMEPSIRRRTTFGCDEPRCPETAGPRDDLACGDAAANSEVRGAPARVAGARALRAEGSAVHFPAILCRIARFSDVAWPRSGGAKMFSGARPAGCKPRPRRQARGAGTGCTCQPCRGTPVPCRGSLRPAANGHSRESRSDWIVPVAR